MFNLFDILQAQSGGMQSLGQQFGLSPDQSRKAMEALLPALTIGLQRNAASDPAGFGRLFGFAGGDRQYGARTPAQPDLLLGQLFGSPALSQAVLQQAAAVSGIGQQALRQMLPIMAGMVVAGLVHAMLNQPPPAPPAAREPEPQPPTAFPAAELWNDWMSTFLSSAGAAGSKPKTPPPARIAKPASHERESHRQESAAPPRPVSETPPLEVPKAAAPSKSLDDAGDVPLEVFQQMFQTGAQVQEQNVKAMQDIFDSFWSAPSSGLAETAQAAPATPTTGQGQRKAKQTVSKPTVAKPRSKKSH